ncbi:MAG: hypothetical protein AAF614_21800 [Chloroflexota bacterium]
MIEKIAYLFFGIAFLAWLIALIVGLVAAWPYGIFGLLVIAGMGLLLIKVIRERWSNQEDEHYSKNVHL